MLKQPCVWTASVGPKADIFTLFTEGFFLPALLVPVGNLFLQGESPGVPGEGGSHLGETTNWSLNALGVIKCSPVWALWQGHLSYPSVSAWLVTTNHLTLFLLNAFSKV